MGKPKNVRSGTNGIATRLPPLTAQISVTRRVGAGFVSTSRNASPLTTALLVVPSLRWTSTRSTPSATMP